MKVTNPKSYPKEDDEAKIFAKTLNDLWALKQIQCYSHIVNENSTRSVQHGRKLKAMGKNPGVPDYIIVLKTKTLFVELKRQKNERGTTESEVSEPQEYWVGSLNRANCPSKICYGANEAINFVQSML